VELRSGCSSVYKVQEHPSIHLRKLHHLDPAHGLGYPAFPTFWFLLPPLENFYSQITVHERLELSPFRSSSQAISSIDKIVIIIKGLLVRLWALVHVYIVTIHRITTSTATSLLQLALLSVSFHALAVSISSIFSHCLLTLTQCSGIGRPKRTAKKSSLTLRWDKSETYIAMCNQHKVSDDRFHPKEE
jgi:hypothetical protein